MAAFTPWNFPINQAIRKIATALAAGCSIIVKGPEETPASCMELVRCYIDAGLPPGVVQLVFGVPAEISEYLIPHPVIRKISFTGSTPVGKQLAALAGLHMKRATMELGGHAPAIVFDDADIGGGDEDAGRRRSSAMPARSACRPTRFLVQNEAYDQFVEGFTAGREGGEGRRRDGERAPDGPARQPAPDHGDGGLDRATRCRRARRSAPAASGSATWATSSSRRCITDVTDDMRVMNEEPFGPLAVIAPFESMDDVVEEANRLPFGLASLRVHAVGEDGVGCGGEGRGGDDDDQPSSAWRCRRCRSAASRIRGYGSEGGAEAIEAYLNTKFVTQAGM